MAALLVTVLVALVTVAAGQCPGASDLQAADGTRVCALLYTDDSVYYDNCCGGKALVVDPGSDVPYMPVGYSGRISSLVVGTNCELTVWSRSGKKGNTKVFEAGTVPRLREVKQGTFSNWDNAIKSYYCKCN
ncbi:syncollin [Pezoporus wallicus]|uniref:syncollin n=1 Tax=Pezoporus wallicus TaxID=35540 RepID=UPI00254D74EA|nr:syncollin [Pezoporus wallicus]XP_061300412.1 syncollin [Pezoporus flaviventris]